MGTQPSQPVAPLRRTVVGREEVDREPFRPKPRWVVPPWMRRGLSFLLLLFVLPWLLGLLLEETQKPADLASSVLTGPRLATGPVCIEEAVDLSGSMVAFTPQRVRAETELFAFGRRELEPDDSMAVAHFAGSAQLSLPPTPMDSLTTTPAPQAALADGTALAPAVDALLAARSPSSTGCALRALIVITDGQISDSAETANALARGGYARVFAVVPAGSGWGRPAPLQGDLSGVAVQRFHDADTAGRIASILFDAKPLDVVFGEIAASLTGQRLEQQNRQLL